MRNAITKVALAAAALVGASTSAHAYVFLQLADLAADNVTIQSEAKCNTSLAQVNVAGGNCSTVDGFLGYAAGGNFIGFLGTVGSFSIATTSGIGNQPGNPAFASLNTSSTQVTNNNAQGSGLDSMYINFTGFDFLLPNGADKTLFGTASYSGTVLPGVGGSIKTNFYADGTNGGNPFNGLTCSMAVTTDDSCNTGPLTAWNDPAPAQFSLRTQQYFTINDRTQVNATTSVIAGAIPEPMTTSLVGVALLGMALASRRRSTKA